MHKLTLVSPLILAACGAQSQPVTIDEAFPSPKCVQSDALDVFKGQPASAELGARIIGATHASRLRWVPFNAVITLEYDTLRVTVRLDSQNRVISASCG